ncbi:MAG: PEP-CTERM sorting domain-containing protein [Phycisphaerae bacterium]|nr:PEP-CTERM sorting domain-containing protein [Phycisphaerae bacterium]
MQARTVTTSLATPRWVSNTDNYTDSLDISTGWELDTIDDALHLHVLGTDVGPGHTLLGPPNESTNQYNNANGSIAGNKPHNPFLAESATFVLDIPGVTEDSVILGITFEFNTSPGSTITVGEPPLIPEPATLSLLAFGGLLILKRQRRRRS